MLKNIGKAPLSGPKKHIALQEAKNASFLQKSLKGPHKRIRVMNVKPLYISFLSAYFSRFLC